MQIEIYADVIFIVNFLMDFFIFWIMNKLIKKVKIPRLVLGSIIASLSYCVLIFINLENFFITAFFMFFSIFICFMPKTFKETFKLFLSFIIISFFIGGMTTGIFYFINNSTLFKEFIVNKSQHYSVVLLLFSTIMIYILIKIFIQFYRQNIIKKQCFCKINVYNKGKKTQLNALIDTGNSLCEPITNMPVIIAEFKAIEPLFPTKIRNDVIKDISLKNINEISKIFPIRIIPFSAIGSEHGLLIGFNVEKAEIITDNTIILNDITIAVYNYNLSKNGIYNALLNPEMLCKKS